MFSLPKRARVEANIHDVNGRLVRRLLNGYDGPGERRLHWDGRTSSGAPALQGVYFLALHADGQALGERQVVVVR